MICATVMVAMSVVVAYAESSVSGGGSGLIRGTQPITIWEATNYMCLVLNTDIFVVWGSYNIENYGSDYGVKFSSKGTHAEWGKHIWYVYKDDDGNIQSELEVNVIDITGSGNNRFAGESSPATISAADLKKAAADYNSRYMPITAPDQIIWSYQRSYDDYGLKDAKSANPVIPIYWNKYDWGGRTGWTKGIYVLPFVTDDDVSSPYYCKYYYHFYKTADEEHNITLHCDAYNLLNNQIVESECRAWAWKNINSAELSPAVIALNLQANSGWRIQAFDSDANYFVGNFYVGNLIHRNTGGDPLFNGDISSLSVGTTMSTLKSAATFTPDSSVGDDWGAYLSSSPFELWANQTAVDWSRVPDNYYITIEGDNFYDYTITDPDNGKNSSFGDFIIDYDLPDLEDPDDGDDNGGGSGGSGGSVSGEIKVGGKVDVSGDIVIKADPIDINVNVNTSGGSSGAGTSEGVIFDEDISLNNYYGWMQEQTTGFGAFMQAFFGWLPEPIVIMLCAGFALVILARFLGR